MRCFIAIDIDDRIRKGLSNLQDELRRKVDVGKGDVKWARSETTHLTLKFLGEIKDERAVEVCNITKDVAGRHKRFELHVQSVGYFGGKSARVLWVGTGQGGDRLLQVQEDREERLDVAGLPGGGRKFSGARALGRRGCGARLRSSGGQAEGADVVLSGGYGFLFFGVDLILGLALPLAVLARRQPGRIVQVAAAVLVLIGTLAVRYVIVMGGQAVPLS